MDTLSISSVSHVLHWLEGKDYHHFNCKFLMNVENNCWYETQYYEKIRNHHLQRGFMLKSLKIYYTLYFYKVYKNLLKNFNENILKIKFLRDVKNALRPVLLWPIISFFIIVIFVLHIKILNFRITRKI